MHKVAAVLFALLFAGAAFAAPSSVGAAEAAPTDSVQAWRARTRAALVKRGDVDGYLAALMMTHGDPHARTAYADDAVRVAPHDADALWMRWWTCSADNACDGATMLAPLRKLEPGNAAVWVPEVTAAVRAGDPFKVTDALKRVAQGTHFDDHAWTIGRRAGFAMIALPPPPRETVAAFKTNRLLFSTANVEPLGIPGVYRVLMACTNLIFFETRKPACNAIAKVLQVSGSQQYEMLGLDLARALANPAAALHARHSPSVSGPLLPAPTEAAAGGYPAGAALHARYRTFVWRTLAWNKLSLAAGADAALGKVIRDAIRAQPNQVAMIKAVMHARGIALTPPQGWKPGAAVGDR